MKIKRILLKIITLLTLLPNILLAQHTIKGVFSPASDYKVLLLYKVTPTVSDYITNAEIQSDGSFQFQLDATSATGIYRIVYAVPQEDFNFDVIYNGKEDVELAFNTETGISFNASVENKLLASYTNSMSAITESINTYFRANKKDTLTINAIYRIQREAQTRFEKQAENTIASHFIKANKPYIPNTYEDVKIYAKNLKTHYFDNIDFNNTTLQSSSFLQERMLNYVFGISDENKNEIANFQRNIDVFYRAIKDVSLEIKRILLIDLWQEMVDLKIEPVANHISKNYLLEIAKSLNDTELTSVLTNYMNISIGNKAPDFSFINKDKSTQKLSNLSGADTYIIVFWSSTCSHCLDEIPQLQNYLKQSPKNNIKVIAIGLEDDDKKWNELTKNYPEFINVLGLGRWENKIGNDYDVHETPTYFMLDKNKIIIDKPYNFKALKIILEK